MFIFIFSTINFFFRSINYLFIFPISNMRISIITLSCCLILVLFVYFLLMAFPLYFLNANFCIIGPCFFFAVASVSQIALILALGESLWYFPAAAAAFILESLWHKSRYGPLWDFPIHDWEYVTPLDWAVLASVTAISMTLGCYGISWRRCGDPITHAWILHRLKAFFSRDSVPIPRLYSPHQAMFWAQWKNKARSFPGMMLFFTGITTIISIFAFNNKFLFNSLFISFFYLIIFSLLIGFFLGDYNNNYEAQGKMASFHASLPVTSLSMAWNSLAVGGLTLVLCALVWVSMFVLAIGSQAALGERQQILEGLAKIPWDRLPLVILLSWSALGACFGFVALESSKITVAFYILFWYLVNFIGFLFFNNYFFYFYIFICHIFVVFFIINQNYKFLYVINFSLFISSLFLGILLLPNNADSMLNSIVNNPIFRFAALSLAYVPLVTSPFAVFASRVR